MVRPKNISGSKEAPRGSAAFATGAAALDKTGPTMPPEIQAVRKVFTEAQRTAQCHQRCRDTLRRLLSKHEAAWDEYFVCLSRILAFGIKRPPDIERLVRFVTLAVGASDGCTAGREEGEASTDTSNGALLARTVAFLLEHSGAADKAVRFRCCELLGCMTTEFSQLPELEEEDLDGVVEVLLPRLHDKEWKVRQQAVSALRPFQFGLEGDEDDEALQEDRVRTRLMTSMMSDSQPQVRQAALGAVTKTVKMFDQLVLRTQDVDERVRMAAFQTLGEDVASKHLQPHQMVTLVKRGLSDTPQVADSCRFMLCAHWFRDAEYDPVELLRRVDVLQVENAHLQKVPEDIVRELVRLGLKAEHERGDSSLGLGFTLPDAKALRRTAGMRIDLASSPASPVGELGGADQENGVVAGPGRRVSPEEALFARVQIEVVKEDKEMSASEKEERLEAILPDTTSLCQHIETKLQELKEMLDTPEEEEAEGPENSEEIEKRIEGEVFVLQQLLKLAAHVDFSEEAGRRRLVNLLQKLLVDVNTTHHLVESTMTALAAAHPSDADFVRVVAELVSDIWDLVHSRKAGDTSMNNASLNASFTSVISGTDGEAGGTPSGSYAPERSGIRAAIPKNMVKERARMLEGIPPIEGLDEGAGGRRDDDDDDDKTPDPASEDDEFMDARSHQSSDAGADADALRQVATGDPDSGESAVIVASAASLGEMNPAEAEVDMRRMFRILDMLSALLTNTKQTLARDVTLTAFEEVISDIFEWCNEVLPGLCPDLTQFHPELMHSLVVVRGKYALLGDAERAFSRHGPFFLEIAQREEGYEEVRISAMQALSDLSLIFRNTKVGPAAGPTGESPDASKTKAATGDVLALFMGILRDRSASRAVVAVAAEVVARFLFAELSHDPELLARLFVLYFEKGSAASIQDPALDDENEGEVEREEKVDARAVGSSVRLSQMLSVYFSALPFQATRPRVRDMLAESMRHVLQVLREVAVLNAAGKKNNEEENEPLALIEVPVPEVIGITWRLLDKASSITPTTGPVSSPSSAVDSVSEERDQEEEQGGPGQHGELESPAKEQTAITTGGAAGHAALCITEELWTLSGIDGVSDLVESLAKVLKSLSLPEDQSTLKRIRNNVDRLEVLGDGQLSSKVSKMIAKYAQVLLAADLTPDEGVIKSHDGDDDGDGEDDEEDGGEELEGRSPRSHVAAGGSEDDGEDEYEEPESMREQAPKRKKSAKASKAASTAKPPPTTRSGRPARQSKLVARERMANAEAVSAALDAAQSTESDSEGSEGDGITEEQHALEGDASDDEEEEEDGGSFRDSVTAREPSSPRDKPLRRPSGANRAALSEIINSPVCT